MLSKTNQQEQIKTENGLNSPNNLVRSQSDNTQNSSKSNENNNLNLLLMNSLTSLQKSTENNNTNLPTMNFLSSPLNLLQNNQKTEENSDNPNNQVIRSIKIEDPNQPPPTDEL